MNIETSRVRIIQIALYGMILVTFIFLVVNIFSGNAASVMIPMVMIIIALFMVLASVKEVSDSVSVMNVSRLTAGCTLLGIAVIGLFVYLILD